MPLWLGAWRPCPVCWGTSAAVSLCTGTWAAAEMGCGPVQLCGPCGVRLSNPCGRAFRSFQPRL
ncbi:hypothetical protein BT67DRAFT_445135 [Trichocladium antarcticum]|uniref:Secreted protein n=1 Tax=Trichocladium antarcticum TaxID=1450529 RepID=A0AAN6UDE9_9PEZI|nr:hypothetical protein BT67DRAFT_445135 [Trichocladium antarcticum]